MDGAQIGAGISDGQVIGAGIGVSAGITDGIIHTIIITGITDLIIMADGTEVDGIIHITIIIIIITIIIRTIIHIVMDVVQAQGPITVQTIIIMVLTEYHHLIGCHRHQTAEALAHRHHQAVNTVVTECLV